MKREHISFGDWLDSASGDWHDSASPHEQERLIKTAYQLLPRTLNRRSEKKAEAAQKAFVEILNHIHDTYFEYHELQFFSFIKWSAISSFNQSALSIHIDLTCFPRFLP